MRDIGLWLSVLGELREDADRSDRAIAKKLGAEHHVVGRVRAAWLADPDALAVELGEPSRAPYRMPPLPRSPAAVLEPEGAVTLADDIEALQGAFVELTERFDRLLAEVRR